MDKLLDKEVHQLYKAPSLTTYLAGAQQAGQQGRMMAAGMAATTLANPRLNHPEAKHKDTASSSAACVPATQDKDAA